MNRTSENRQKKIRQTVILAVFISIASRINFSFMVSGFIIALSVVVMAVCIYCYEDLLPAYIGICSGLFTAGKWMILSAMTGKDPWIKFPDMIYFWTYGILYTLIARRTGEKQRQMRYFLPAIMVCDYLSNMAEIACRSLMMGSSQYSVKLLLSLGAVAVLRSLLIWVIIIPVESYSRRNLRQEQLDHYHELLTQASIFEDVLHLMEKNAEDIEDVMKMAYQLNTSLGAEDIPAELKKDALEIARRSHEVKGDYRNMIGILNDTFVSRVHEPDMRISNLIRMEKTNVEGFIRSRGYPVEIRIEIGQDYLVSETFEMMTILRNLMQNAAEAIGISAASSGDGSPGLITVKTAADSARGMQILSVRDDGPGIPERRIRSIFLPGFSTRFDPRTGDMQRGLGLSLVKDYAEQVFHGTIRAESRKGEYTEFIMEFPPERDWKIGADTADADRAADSSGEDES